MLPFQFQVISAYHHSLGAIKGIREGVFSPPPSMPELDYAGLQGLVEGATTELQTMSREEIDALEGNAVKFKMGDFEIPFTAENFILCQAGCKHDGVDVIVVTPRLVLLMARV